MMEPELVEVSVSDLIINVNNDRHGSLPKGVTPIDWMLENKNKEIRNLAADIVREKKVYELLLVEKKEQGFLVWDGNRRATALKLLANPAFAKDFSTRKYFEKLSEQLQEIPLVRCQIENDPETRDTILDRRHSGAQEGVGQINWHTNEKHNFRKRTGKEKPHIGHAVRDLLISRGLLKVADKIRTSSIEKILSTENQRNKVGVSYENGTLFFTHNEKEVMRSLLKIAKDTESGELNLNKLLTSKQKNKYLEDLLDKGFLPDAGDKLNHPKKLEDSISEISDDEKKKISNFRSPQRKTLIRKENEYNLGQDPKLNRFKDIWQELQFKLDLKNHTNAISVLARVVIEFAVKYYNDSNGVQYNDKNDSLARKIELAANSMSGKNIISIDRASEIINFSKSKDFFSPKTLNSYIHSMDHVPDPDNLVALWDNMEMFILSCINQNRQKKAA